MEQKRCDLGGYKTCYMFVEIDPWLSVTGQRMVTEGPWIELLTQPACWESGSISVTNE